MSEQSLRMTNPRVSVCMITYNHAHYIEQAVRSVLMQKTDFDVELVVGEDCSTDNTREKLLELQAQCPERICVLLREANLGIGKNFIDTYRQCRGDYIALLEGDDFWTDPDKLQRQVDFLDAHSDYSACFHNVRILDEADGASGIMCPDDYPTKFTLEDFFPQNPVSNCSTMFRRGLFETFPDWFESSPIGDWPLHVFNARYGCFGYLPQCMATYRKHSGGTFSSLQDSIRIERELQMFHRLNEFLEYKHRHVIDPAINQRTVILAGRYARAGEYGKARVCAREWLRARSDNPHASLPQFLKMTAILAVPFVFRTASQFRNG